MDNGNQETRDDIVREMRALGTLDEKSTDKVPRRLMALGLRTYADRLEAAAKRERGNAETMRKALKEIVRIVSEWQGSIPFGKVRKIAEAALTRNCDAGNLTDTGKTL